MMADEWQAHVTRSAALAIGEWLEARGRLQQPIAALSLADLEAMAGAAITRFIVLSSERRQAEQDQKAPGSSPGQALTRLLYG